jgi:surfeit locus 1 family protein
MAQWGFRFGSLHFRLRLGWGIAAAAFVALTISLGNWQTRRAEEKLDAARRVDDAMRSAVLSVPSRPAVLAEFEQRKVSVHGRFVSASTFFLDNRVLRGAVGYHVVTPMKIEGGDIYVLVNRGWIEAGNRGVLPVVPTQESLQTLDGLAVTPSKRFIELAAESESGPVRQNLVLEREQRRLGIRLQPFLIEEASDAKDGLQRAWARPDVGADRNRAYALQWYLFALIGGLLYVLLSARRAEPGGH